MARASVSVCVCCAYVVAAARQLQPGQRYFFVIVVIVVIVYVWEQVLDLDPVWHYNRDLRMFHPEHMVVIGDDGIKALCRCIITPHTSHLTRLQERVQS